VSESVRELLRSSLVRCCFEKQIAEARGQIVKPQEEERSPLEAATRQRFLRDCGHLYVTVNYKL
jgi:hypothetical protein